MNIISKFQLVVYFQCCVLIKVKVKVFILDIFDQLVRFCYKTIKPLALMATEPNPIDSEPIRARGKIVKLLTFINCFEIYPFEGKSIFKYVGKVTSFNPVLKPPPWINFGQTVVFCRLLFL